MSDDAVPLSAALERLDVLPDYDAGNGPEPCVHTLAQSAIGLLGAHWSLDDLTAFMAANGVQEAGPTAAAMGHGLCVLRPAPLGPLFLATKDAENYAVAAA